MSRRTGNPSVWSIVDALRDYGIEDIGEDDISAMLTHIGPGVARAVNMSTASRRGAEAGYTVLAALCSAWGIGMLRNGVNHEVLLSLGAAGDKAAKQHGSD